MNTLGFVETSGRTSATARGCCAAIPTFAIVAILTLALGTGANTAIFQLVNAVRLRTLPVERPQELRRVGIDTSDRAAAPAVHEPPADLLRAAVASASAPSSRGFSRMFAWGIDDVGTRDRRRVPARAGPLRQRRLLRRRWASQPQVGRLFAPTDDDQQGCAAPGAVLSARLLAARVTAAIPPSIGQPILARRPCASTSSASRRRRSSASRSGASSTSPMPLCAEPIDPRRATGARQRRTSGSSTSWAGCKPGWTAEQAQAQLAAHLAGDLPRDGPAALHRRRPRRTISRSSSRRRRRRPASRACAAPTQTQLWVLLGATGARAAHRLRESRQPDARARHRARARDRRPARHRRVAPAHRPADALREPAASPASARSAGRCSRSGSAGRWSRSSAPTARRLFVDLAPDWRVFAFIAGVAVAACLLFGLAPALQRDRHQPRHGDAGGRPRRRPTRANASRLRRALVVVQVALSLVLVVGALLFARSLRNLTTLDPGLPAGRHPRVDVDMRRAGHPRGGARADATRRSSERVRAVPGVRSRGARPPSCR